MIAGNNFAWAHIPRAGGDITAELFQYANELFGGSWIKQIISGSAEKEQTFKEAGLDHDRTFLLNIRRLPSFVMSWIIMCAGRLRETDEKCFIGGVYPQYKIALPVPTKEQLFNPDELYGPDYFHEHYGRSLATLPDSLLCKYSDGYQISTWLRLEYLKHDFIRFAESTRGVDGREVDLIGRYSFKIKKPISYDHDENNFFSKEEIQRLYKNNPKWAEIERKAYT